MDKRLLSFCTVRRGTVRIHLPGKQLCKCADAWSAGIGGPYEPDRAMNLVTTAQKVTAGNQKVATSVEKVAAGIEKVAGCVQEVTECVEEVTAGAQKVLDR